MKRLTLFALILLAIEFAGVHGDGNLSPFCGKAISNDSSGACPEVSTFDIVDTAAYAGVWYEIGSTAQFKLSSEAGLDCLQANYTVQTPNNTSRGASLAVVNSGRRVLGPLATLGVTTISTGAKDVCMRARDVCSHLGPPSQMMQSVTEVRQIASMLRKKLPDQATILNDVAQKIEGYGYNISNEFTMMAEHVQRVQILDGYLSAGNDTATANVEQIKLEMIAICKQIDVFVEFVHEMTAARSVLAQVVLKLVIAGELVSSVDVTEASALIGAAEQRIALQADHMKSSLAAMSIAAEVFLVDTGVRYRNVSWSFPGVATQNATNKGTLELGEETVRCKLHNGKNTAWRRNRPLQVTQCKNWIPLSHDQPHKFQNQFSILGLTAPYYIIALEGLPSKGYDAALVYSCTENHVLGTIQQGFFVLSRRPTLLPATLERFLRVAASLGVDLDCENPFLTSGCNCASRVEACSHWTP